MYTGTYATRKLKEIDGESAVLKGDDQHFWPYGLNYASEVKSNQDLINHCLIVNEIYKDLYPDRIPTGAAAYAMATHRPQVTWGNNRGFSIALPAAGRIDAAIFAIDGKLIEARSEVSGTAGTYLIHLNQTPLAQGQYLYRITVGNAVESGAFFVRR